LNLRQNIITEALKLFDTAGIARDNEDSLIVLGLASYPKRDLDEFSRDNNGTFRIDGFETHVAPRLKELVEIIREMGLPVEVVGWCGYPLEGYLNLKQKAVAAGIGQWGKNAMVINKEFGPLLRLMSLRIPGILLQCTGTGEDTHLENPLCKDCTVCLDACPVGVLKPYYVTDLNACLANVQYNSRPGKVVCCDKCWTACPFSG